MPRKPRPSGHSRARSNATPPTWPDRARRVAIHVFLIFHIVAIACWCLPIGSPLIAAGKELVRPYMLWTGLFQSWDMFSPSPVRVNNYLEAIVLYKDGNTRIWPFPRMERLSLLDRYRKERYRKFSEVLNDDKYAPLWPDATRFIARQQNTGSIPVKMVLLVRYWSDILPPKEAALRAAFWNSDVFYGYRVQPEDLP